MYITQMVQEEHNKALKRAYEYGFKKGKELNKDDQNLNYKTPLRLRHHFWLNKQRHKYFANRLLYFAQTLFWHLQKKYYKYSLLL